MLPIAIVYMCNFMLPIHLDIMFSSFQRPPVLQRELKAKHVITHMQPVNNMLNHGLHPVRGSVTIAYRKPYKQFRRNMKK